jgi:hypothetical protein
LQSFKAVDHLADTSRSDATADGHIAVNIKGWTTTGALERLQSGGMFLRNHVEHIDTNAVQWKQTGAGVYTKTINANQDSGARTVLIKLVPEEGFDPPSKIHYHTLSEELLVLDGLLTFDHKTWLDGISYIYHPPFMIHGFKSATPETTTLLARGTGELDFNFPDPSEVDIDSPVDGSTPTRDLLYLNNINDKVWSPIYGDDGQQVGEMLSLGTDSQTGEGACFERYYSGWTRAAISDGFAVYDEVYVLDGEISSGSNDVWAKGHYWYRALETPQPALQSRSGALVFRCFG